MFTLAPFSDTPKGPEFQASNGRWYSIKEADMSHDPMSAVEYWNTTGRFNGAKSAETRAWMLNSENYVLDHFSINRRQGSMLPRYLPPDK